MKGKSRFYGPFKFCGGESKQTLIHNESIPILQPTLKGCLANHWLRRIKRSICCPPPTGFGWSLIIIAIGIKAKAVANQTTLSWGSQLVPGKHVTVFILRNYSISLFHGLHFRGHDYYVDFCCFIPIFLLFDSFINNFLVAMNNVPALSFTLSLRTRQIVHGTCLFFEYLHKVLMASVILESNNSALLFWLPFKLMSGTTVVLDQSLTCHGVWSLPLPPHTTRVYKNVTAYLTHCRFRVFIEPISTNSF